MEALRGGLELGHLIAEREAFAVHGNVEHGYCCTRIGCRLQSNVVRKERMGRKKRRRREKEGEKAMPGSQTTRQVGRLPGRGCAPRGTCRERSDHRLAACVTHRE